MTRKHRPYGKNEASEKRGRDKGVHAKARKSAVRAAAKKVVKDEAAALHSELLNAFRL